MVYWEISRWVLGGRTKTVALTACPQTNVQPGSAEPVVMPDTEAPTRISHVPIGTGVADAAHPSTLPVLEISEGELDAEKTSRRDPSHQ